MQAAFDKSCDERKSRNDKRHDRRDRAYRRADDKSGKRKYNNNKYYKRNGAEKIYDNVEDFHKPARKRKNSVFVADNQQNAERKSYNECKERCDKCDIKCFKHRAGNIVFQYIDSCLQLFGRKHIIHTQTSSTVTFSTEPRYSETIFACSAPPGTPRSIEP